MKFLKNALFTLLILFTGILVYAQNGCPIEGQNPSNAFPVCGSNVFVQGVVGICNGRNFVVTQCVNDGIIYNDKNPYWYKFTCFKTGTLSFLIIPTNLGDDYDWQLFDITNHKVEDIYTTPSLNVANNWSGFQGVTGATSSGTSIYNCGGDHPPISAMPTIIKGHDYLLMVSHFSGTGQSGYQLSFNTGSGGGTAVISDTLTPRIANIKLKCTGDRIGVKLNKAMLCSTIATDGSGFNLSNNQKIDSVVGRGCRSGFDTDSITIFLAKPYATGNYTLTTKADASGKSIEDICGTSIPIGDTFPFFKVDELPTLMDSITTPLPCAPQQLELVFKTPLHCNSVLANGSQFNITGPSPVTIAGATTKCDTNGFTTKIYINLTSPISIDGIYKIHLSKETNFNTIINECSVATPIDSLSFKVVNAVSANYVFKTILGCKQDTIKAKYEGVSGGSNNVTSWQWLLNDTLIGVLSNTNFVYNTFNNKSLKLIVSNGVCTDSLTNEITPIDHSIKAGFLTSEDTICPTQQIMFKDTSKGIVTSWEWNFDNGNSSALQYPPAESYPFSVAAKKYSVALIIKNIAGCIDSTTHTITVKQGVASIIDSIIPLTCSPKFVTLHFSNKLVCSSIAHNGSNFFITGPSNVFIDSTSLNCTNGETDTVHLALSSPINTTGNYLVKIKRSFDNSQINNVCNIFTPLGTSKNFNAYGAVSSAFTESIKYGCKQAAITFKNGGVNGINHWLWNVNDSTNSTNCYQADTTITYTDLSDKKVNLVVSNPACTDSGSVQTIKMANYNDTVKAGFIIEKNDVGTIEQTYFICPVEKAIFKDTSIGDIKHWLWTFGNGLNSTEEMPSPQSYQAKGKSAFDYPVNLIIRGNYCSDTTTNFIKVIPNCLIDVPRAFTPNGDNLNDYLYPLNAYKADNLDFKVFNRFGQLVFETRDWTVKWDGKIKGADPIVGTYIWTLTYTDHDTKAPVSLSGTTVLIK